MALNENIQPNKYIKELQARGIDVYYGNDFFYFDTLLKKEEE